MTVIVLTKMVVSFKVVVVTICEPFIIFLMSTLLVFIACRTNNVCNGCIGRYDCNGKIVYYLSFSGYNC